MADPVRREDPVHATSHCLTALPYRAVVFVGMNRRTPLYRVAGSSKGPLGAKKALEEAFAIYRGDCFYCRKPIRPEQLSIDRAEARASGGKNELQNLLISHKDCNRDKGPKAIEAYNPDAGREWLAALLAQIQDRLNRI